jgi:hypothetical protein
MSGYMIKHMHGCQVCCHTYQYTVQLLHALSFTKFALDLALNKFPAV